jgi:hypothetical protein
MFFDFSSTGIGFDSESHLVVVIGDNFNNLMISDSLYSENEWNEDDIVSRSLGKELSVLIGSFWKKLIQSFLDIFS